MNHELLRAFMGDEATEAQIDAAVTAAQDYVRAYCGVDAVPEALDCAVLSMAAALLRSELGTDRAGVSALSVGDAEVRFDNADASAIFDEYRTVLNRYRVVRF